MKNRQILSILCVITTCLSLTSCGVVSIGSKVADSLKEEETENVTDEVETQADTKNDDKDDKSGKNDGPLITKSDNSDNVVSGEDTEFVYYTIDGTYESTKADVPGYDWQCDIATYRYQTVKIESDEYNALKKSIDDFNSMVEESMKESREWIDDLALGDKDTLVENYNYYYCDSLVEIPRSDSKVFSILNTNTSFAGGPHGFVGFYGYNYDSQTGAPIYAKDLFTDTKKLPSVLADALLERYDTAIFNFIDPDADESAKEQLSHALDDMYFTGKDTYSLQFYIGYTGVNVIFNIYELAPYASGYQQVFLSFAENSDIINSKYVFTGNDYVEKMYVDTEGDSDYLGSFSFSDTPLRLTITSKIDSEFGFDSYGGFTVAFEDDEYDISDFCFEVYPYFVSANGKQYLYLATRGENDYSLVRVMELNKNGITYVGEFDGEISGMVDPKLFKISKRMNDLSTYQATANFEVGKNGMPVRLSKDYRISTSNNLTVKEGFNAVILDPDTWEEDGGIELKPGDELTFVATDGESYVDFLRQDDVPLRIYYKLDGGYEHIIDGKSEYDLFVMLWYAG